MKQIGRINRKQNTPKIDPSISNYVKKSKDKKRATSNDKQSNIKGYEDPYQIN